MMKRTLEDIGKYSITGKSFSEIKDITHILENISLEDLDIEWEKTYLREGPFYKIEVLVFKEGEKSIGIRPINLDIERAYLNVKERCNKKYGLHYLKTQEDNAWTEFDIPGLNSKLIVYHNAVRKT